jgi:hypothetical protein
VNGAVNNMGPIPFQPSSPAKAGDPLLQRQQALAWAKALELAKVIGSRECAPDDGLRVPTVQKDSVGNDDTVGEMADTAQARVGPPC